MSLRTYAEKRDFRKTPEPKGEPLSKSRTHRFVIQKHEASHLHYDFRLEIGGTLKSWAVPKGIPMSRGEKRLAMHVEDHPVSYRDFEGVIPKGQYGGGTVMVWDYGTFRPQSVAPAKDLAEGKLHFVLHGKKLSGEWYLVRLKKDDKQWLLIRGGEDLKPLSKKQDDTSALSRKTMKRLAEGERVWKSNRKTSGKPAPSQSRLLPIFEPMMAKLMKSAPPGQWQYEIKYDGFRALAFMGKGTVQLVSRNGKDLGKRFPEVMEVLRQLPVEDTILDGEIVVLDRKGRSSFQLLQTYEQGEKTHPLSYYVFDLPQLNGEDLRSLPLANRQSRLSKILRKPEVLQISKVLEGDGDLLLKQAGKLGLEGLIGKRKDSPYEAGRRSGAWIKLKTHLEQEFVIGGFSNPSGGRHHFGAILVGVFQNGKLIFCGKVGTGFNNSLLRSLYATFKSLETSKNPFEDENGMTRAELKRCHWLKPKLVCEVRFSEWTRDARLRQPVFLGLRDDKDAKDVIREEAL